MPLVASFRIPHASSRKIALGRQREESPNHVSVIIGANGTRKSLVLRQLALDAIYQINHPKLDNPTAELTGTSFSRRPSKVIAISATATDRFPSKPTPFDARASGKFATRAYRYVGPRTASNLISRNNSIQEVISCTLSAPERLVNRASFLAEVLQQVNSKPHFAFELDAWRSAASGRPPGDKPTTFLNYVEDLRLDRIGASGYGRNVLSQTTSAELAHLATREGRKLIEEVDSRLRQFGNTWPLRKSASGQQKGFRVAVDILTGAIDSFGVSCNALDIALRLGYLRPGKFSLFGADQDELSAGQWGLFSTMFSLALAATDDCLILIDEPENGLHPGWQRRYCSQVLEALKPSIGCHVVVATHAPMILGDLPVKHSDVVLLRAAETDSNEIMARNLHAPSGWDANSVLEDIFDLKSSHGYAVTEIVDQALVLIAGGLDKNAKELRALIPELRRLGASLPADGALTATIASVIRVVGAADVR